MTAVANIHASCVLLDDAGKAYGAPPDTGVLLLGASSAGKSDLALRLIADGARLVADDRTELFVSDGALMARAPATLAGMIEARGVGIVALPFAPQAGIALAVELVEASEVMRLPHRTFYKPPPALDLPPTAHPPLIFMAAFEASTSAKIGLAAAAFARALFRDRPNT